MRTFARGYIAIMTVLALLVFSLTVLLSVPYFSIGGAQQALVLSQGEGLLASLEGCAADALLQGVRDENYNGGTADYFGTSCEVSVEKEDALWTFSFLATKDGLTRTLHIEAERSLEVPSTFTLHSWLEQ